MQPSNVFLVAVNNNDYTMALTSTSIPFKKVIIIGAGFSGLAMACQIKRKLKSDEFTIYDRAPGFGGTWQANTCALILPRLPNVSL